MNRTQQIEAWSLATLVAAAIAPLSACGGSNPPANTASAATTSGGMSPAPAPGYPGAPPPGYPGTAPTPSYPPMAQPTTYPPAAQTAPYPPPVAQTPQPGYTAPAGTPAPSGTQAPPGPLAPTDPNSLQGILQGIQTALQGTTVPGGLLSGDVTDAGLKLFAARAAPGMQPEGDEVKQNMTEGQHAVSMITLQAGKCYTVVGFSAPGAVKDLDLNLLAPPLYMTLAGQDLTHNNTPTIGGAPNPMCPVIAFPLQYKLDVFAKSGSGQVAVQLYSKPH